MKTSTQAAFDLLRRYESPNVTFIDSAAGWPIVWKKARGVSVWDADGKKYLDLTAAFGVAAAGHANPRVVRAGQRQMAALLHAMGDVHPHQLKGELARELSRITFERWRDARGERIGTGKTIFCSSGFEAVEAALKTAMLATGRDQIIAFEGGYHGLGYGALNATHREHFREPFRRQLAEFSSFVPYPAEAAEIDAISHQIKRLFRSKRMGAILVEPAQARGGMRVPPRGFLTRLRELCDENHALLVVDEIFTGFGRTGKWFGVEHSQTIPDLICLGKALTGGFPLSACVGRAALMDTAWPLSAGEAIHTSTFLGHPVGCAMALANIREIRSHDLVRRSAAIGRHLEAAAKRMSVPGLRLSYRGLGLFGGIEVCSNAGRPAPSVALSAIQRILRSGYILLPEGEPSNVISFTPPLTITTREIDACLEKLEEILSEASAKSTTRQER